MAGINRTGQPNSTDTYLGRGEIWLATLDLVTYKPTHFRHVGNCIRLALTSEVEKLEHFSSRTGVRSIDREVVLSQKLGVSLTMDETMNFENLALFVSGTANKDVANTASNTSGPAVAAVTDRLLNADALKGRAYELSGLNGGRLYDLSTNPAHLIVKSGAGAVGAAATLAFGVDYTVDRVWGMVFLLSTGSHVDGNNLWFSYAPQGSEKTLDVVKVQTSSKTSVFLRYKSINAADNDKQILLDLHSVSLSADGDLELISDEFGEIPLTGVAERNEIGYPTDPVGNIYYHADALSA